MPAISYLFSILCFFSVFQYAHSLPVQFDINDPEGHKNPNYRADVERIHAAAAGANKQIENMQRILANPDDPANRAHLDNAFGKTPNVPAIQQSVDNLEKGRVSVTKVRAQYPGENTVAQTNMKHRTITFGERFHDPARGPNKAIGTVVHESHHALNGGHDGFTDLPPGSQPRPVPKKEAPSQMHVGYHHGPGFENYKIKASPIMHHNPDSYKVFGHTATHGLDTPMDSKRDKSKKRSQSQGPSGPGEPSGHRTPYHDSHGTVERGRQPASGSGVDSKGRPRDKSTVGAERAPSRISSTRHAVPQVPANHPVSVDRKGKGREKTLPSLPGMAGASSSHQHGPVTPAKISSSRHDPLHSSQDHRVPKPPTAERPRAASALGHSLSAVRPPTSQGDRIHRPSDSHAPLRHAETRPPAERRPVSPLGQHHPAPVAHPGQNPPTLRRRPNIPLTSGSRPVHAERPVPVPQSSHDKHPQRPASAQARPIRAAGPAHPPTTGDYIRRPSSSSRHQTDGQVHHALPAAIRPPTSHAQRPPSSQAHSTPMGHHSERRPVLAAGHPPTTQGRVPLSSTAHRSDSRHAVLPPRPPTSQGIYAQRPPSAQGHSTPARHPSERRPVSPARPPTTQSRTRVSSSSRQQVDSHHPHGPVSRPPTSQGDYGRSSSALGHSSARVQAARPPSVQGHSTSMRHPSDRVHAPVSPPTTQSRTRVPSSSTRQQDSHHVHAAPASRPPTSQGNYGRPPTSLGNSSPHVHAQRPPSAQGYSTPMTHQSERRPVRATSPHPPATQHQRSASTRQPSGGHSYTAHAPAYPPTSQSRRPSVSQSHAYPVNIQSRPPTRHDDHSRRPPSSQAVARPRQGSPSPPSRIPRPARDTSPRPPVRSSSKTHKYR